MINGFPKFSQKHASRKRLSSTICVAKREDTPLFADGKEESVGGVAVGYFTDVGSRPKNDDFGCFEVVGNRLVCALSDGIGGASFGNMASRVASLSAIRTLRSVACMNPPVDPGESLAQVILKADEDVCELKRLIETNDDGSTLLVALQDNDRKGTFRLAWIGDTVSFHYVAKKKALVPVGNPGRAAAGCNRLDGALGYHAEVAGLSRYGTIRMAEGDLIVMCTDGVWDVPGALDADSISKLAHLSPEMVAQGIVELAVHDLRGSDNATAIVIKALPELF